MQIDSSITLRQIWNPTYMDSNSKSNIFCYVTIGELPNLSVFPSEVICKYLA